MVPVNERKGEKGGVLYIICTHCYFTLHDEVNFNTDS